MLCKLSIIGAVVAVVLMIPTTLSAQMGGAINPGVHVGALLIPALPFVVPSSEVSLARILELGARRVGKFTVVVSILPLSSADDGVWRVLCHGSASASPW
jgi:hypothetical protein